MPNPEMTFKADLIPPENRIDQTTQEAILDYSIGKASHRWKFYGTLSGNMEGKLTIGSYTYDGSADVDIPVYDGSYN